MRLVHSVRCACCLLALAFLCVLLTGRGAAVGSAAQGPQGDRPVEQTRKNIQVLKGLPDSQLLPLMNLVSASLGVRCDFCHVVEAEGPGRWKMERDDKPQKATARKMMQMVIDLNKGNRDLFGANGVTCYTCHAGHQRPTTLPQLPLAESAHEGGAPAGGVTAGAARPAEPTAEQVLNRYVEAVGGRAAVAKVGTLVMKGTREASQGRVWPFEISVKGADKYLSVANVPQQGEQRVGFAAGKGWAKGPRGQRELGPGELKVLRESVLYSTPIKIAEPFPAMQFRGQRKVGDRDANVLGYEPSPGIRKRLYFDRQTGLLLREQTFTDTVLTPIPEQVDYDDYRDIGGGVMMPFTIRYSSIDTFFSFTRKLAEIKPNALLDDALFGPPPVPQPTPAPAPKP
jgi:hypothetical protein